MAIKVYSPTDFEDTSSGVSIDGNLVVDTSVLYVDTANNKVGIGTASPATSVDVVDAIPIVTLRSDSNSYASLSYYSNSVQKGLITYHAGNDSLQLSHKETGTTSNDPHLVIKEGNVGIGTTSPAYKLDVSGTGKFGGDLYNSGIIRTRSSDYGILSTYGSQGFSYEPLESLSPAIRYWIRFDYTNNASYPYLTNRTPNGAVAIKTGIAAGGGENEHFRINGGDGVVNAYFTDANVGIGTTSPSGELHIKSASTNANLYIQRSTYDPWRFSAGSTYLAFMQDASEKMRITGAGNVGIGTSSPGDPLHISSGNSDDFIRIENTSTYTGLWMNDGGTNNGWLVMSGYTNTPSPGDFSIREYGVQTSLVIKQTSGNVGIGTTNPVQKLSVLGNIYQRTGDFITWSNGDAQIGAVSGYNLAFSTYDGSSAMVERLRITSSGNVGIGTTNPTTKLYVDAGESTFNRGNSDGAIARFRGKNAEQAVIGTVTSWFDSNVGIGTTSPSAKLELNESSTSSTPAVLITNDTGNQVKLGVVRSLAGTAPNTALFEYDSDLRFIAGAGTTNEVIRFNSSGNVGIGTTSPGEKLVVNSGGTGVSARFTGNTASSEIYLGTNGVQSQYTNVAWYTNNGNAQIWKAGTGYTAAGGAGSLNIYNSNGKIAFHPAGNFNAMTIDTNSNVGIGTTSPTEKLEVDGTVKADSFISVLDPASNNGTFVKVYEDTHKRMYTANLDFSFTAAGTYNFNLVFPNSGGYQYDLTAVNSRGGLYRNFGTLKDSSYIYWESDEDFTHRAEGDLHLISNLNGGMYFSADTTYFLSDGVTDAVQTGTANWSYAIVRYSIYIPYYAGDATGTWKLHLTTYGDTGSNVPQFVLA